MRKRNKSRIMYNSENNRVNSISSPKTPELDIPIEKKKPMILKTITGNLLSKISKNLFPNTKFQESLSVLQSIEIERRKTIRDGQASKNSKQNNFDSYIVENNDKMPSDNLNPIKMPAKSYSSSHSNMMNMKLNAKNAKNSMPKSGARFKSNSQFRLKTQQKPYMRSRQLGEQACVNYDLRKNKLTRHLSHKQSISSSAETAENELSMKIKPVTAYGNFNSNRFKMSSRGIENLSPNDSRNTKFSNRNTDLPGSIRNKPALRNIEIFSSPTRNSSSKLQTINLHENLRSKFSRCIFSRSIEAL